jgi:lipopolysaccharide export system permease protein
MTGTLARYFGRRFLSTLFAILAGVFILIILLDYVEQMRRLSDVPNISALLVAKMSLYRVPQIAERILPFCVLIGAMSCYLGLSRRLELVVSRAAGISAWQFTAPAIMVALVVGIIATAVYNPLAAILHERSKRLEAEISGNTQVGLQATVNGFWVSQRSNDGQSFIIAAISRAQGVLLSNVTVRV